MISREDFLKLRRGDVVLFGARRRPRIVEVGPANFEPGRSHAVRFAILRRSWTNRAETVYGYNDVKHLLALPGLPVHTAPLRRATAAHLRSIGFDPRAEFLREAREQARLCKLFGKQFKCGRGRSWPKGL